jgi:hypothetical protein
MQGGIPMKRALLILAVVAAAPPSMASTLLTSDQCKQVQALASDIVAMRDRDIPVAAVYNTVANDTSAGLPLKMAYLRVVKFTYDNKNWSERGIIKQIDDRCPYSMDNL